jgi:predicted DNA-binding protein YlxM (UPF0122 family)
MVYMDKITKLSLLLDFYGKLLTPKQYEIFDLHYNNDLSLSEISENLGITRQGVFDTLKRAENLLCEYENNLHLVNKFIKNNDKLKEVYDYINDMKERYENEEDIKDEFGKVQSMMQDLISVDE